MTFQNNHIDIEIISNDLALGVDGAVRFVSGVDCVQQDIKHAILESGLLPLLVAERSATQIALIKNKICGIVEDDLRVMPGTVTVQNVSNQVGVFMVEGQTMDYRKLTLTVGESATGNIRGEQ